MPRRSLFICGEEDWTRAQQWARAGLVGPSLWLVAPDGPSGPIVDAQTRSLPDDTDGPLGKFLGLDTDLERVQLIWCPPPGCTDLRDHPWNGQALEELRVSLGQQFLDGVAVFAAQDQAHLPELSADWSRIIVGPEQAIYPGGADAPNGDADDSRLHVALALGGAVAGSPEKLLRPLIQEGWSNEEICATAFTSTILGGLQLDAAAQDHHERTLPWANAAGIAPRRFYDDQHQLKLIADAVAYVLSAGDPPLRWLPVGETAVSFARDQQIGLSAFAERFSSFVEFLLHHSKPVSWQAKAYNAIVDGLQGSDMGAEIARRDDSPGIIPAPDLFAFDRQQVELMRQLWDENRDTGANLPSRECWRAVIDTTCGLIDGSDLPQGLNRPVYHDRACVCGPLTVLGFADPEGTLFPAAEERPGTIAGLPHAPASEAVATTAAARVKEHLEQPGLGLVPTSSSASSVTSELASEARRYDDEIRAEQAQACGDPRRVAGLSFLDTLRTSVIADRIQAGLFADRWFRIATGTLNGLIPLKGALFRFLVTSGSALSGLLVTVNLVRPELFLQLLAYLGIAATPGLVWGGIGGVSAALLSGPVVWFFYHYEAYRTRGIRQAEARRLLFHAAWDAREEHRRLISADRILHLWTQVLRGVYPLRDIEPSAPNEVPAVSLPNAWTEVRMAVPERDLRAWLRDETEGECWRHRAIHELLTRWSDKHGESAAAVLADVGLRDGLLHELATSIDEQWRDLLGELTRRDGQRLRVRALNSGLPLDPEDNGRTWAVEDFLGRVTKPGHQPGEDYHRVSAHAGSVHRETCLDQARGTPSAEVIASRTCLYQTPLEPARHHVNQAPHLDEGISRF